MFLSFLSKIHLQMLGMNRGGKKIEKRGKKREEEVWRWGQEINLSLG